MSIGIARAGSDGPVREASSRTRRRWLRRVTLVLLAVAAAVLGRLGWRCVPRGTVVTPTADAKIQHARNALWCATAQLSWDRLAEAVGTKGLPVEEPADTTAVEAMNREPFPAGALDPKTFVAMGGLVREGVRERFERALVDRFGRVPEPVKVGDLGPEGAAAFSYLLKEMRFATAFADDLAPLPFHVGPLPWVGTARVRSFGGRSGDDALDQVRLQWEDDAGDPGEFILELRPETNDRILLARVEPEDTLWATWHSVAEHLGGEGRPLPPGARLAVPVIDVGERDASFDSLRGPLVAGDGTRLSLVRFEQWTKFRLDRMGARLESFTLADARGETRFPPHPDYLLDRPFLLALVERGATRPYFLLWVANADVLERAD